MNWKGKLAVLVLAGVAAGYFFFRSDPRFVQTWNTISTHAQGIARQVSHDFQGVQKTLGSISRIGSQGKWQGSRQSR